MVLRIMLRPRQFFTSCFLLLCFVFVVAMRREEETDDIRHLVVVSSTYFYNSTGFDLNTMVTLFSSEKSFPHTLTCWSRNESGTFTTSGLIQQASVYGSSCRWGSYIVRCEVAQQPTEFALSSTEGIPFRLPANGTIGTMACFNPLFFFEDWEKALLTLEFYRQYEVELQVYYIQSALADILDLIQVYQARGYAKVEPWHKIKLGKLRGKAALEYDPNQELERGNQPAAHTDCLLNYRDAAEFIVFADVGDIFIPKLGGSYAQEFRQLASFYPVAAGFVYERQRAVFIDQTPDKFSLLYLANNSYVVSDHMSFKTVVIPSRVKTYWIHIPGLVEPSYSLQPTFRKTNPITHLQGLSMDAASISTGAGRKRVRFENVTQMDDTMRIFLSHGGRQELSAFSPQRHYKDMLRKCYNLAWYDFPYGLINCPSPSRCEAPSVSGVKCVVAQRWYEHKKIIPTLWIHYPKERRGFELRYDGCV